jgi:hypothetical protein
VLKLVVAFSLLLVASCRKELLVIGNLPLLLSWALTRRIYTRSVSKNEVPEHQMDLQK